MGMYLNSNTIPLHLLESPSLDSSHEYRSVYPELWAAIKTPQLSPGAKRNVTKYGSPGNCSRQISGYIYVIAVPRSPPPCSEVTKNCIIRVINKLEGRPEQKERSCKARAAALRIRNKEKKEIWAQVAVPLEVTLSGADNILETMLLPTKLDKINNSLARVQLIFR